MRVCGYTRGGIEGQREKERGRRDKERKREETKKKTHQTTKDPQHPPPPIVLRLYITRYGIQGLQGRSIGWLFRTGS